MEKQINDIIQTLLKILPSNKPVPLHEPFFSGNEKKYINDCIDSRFVSSIGKYVTKFETMLSEFTGSKYAIAAVNGTCALHISLLVGGVKKGDEVLVPALTFVATANAVTYCDAVPHFIDSNPVNLGIDIEKLDHYLQQNTETINKTCINKKTQRPIRAIIPVHIFGTPVDMDPLQKICRQFHLTLIEDAAESLGSY